MSTTKKVNITLQVDEHILKAIRMNTPPGKPSLEDELQSLVDKVYRRYVSKDVRDFIELINENTAPKKKTKPAADAETVLDGLDEDI